MAGDSSKIRALIVDDEPLARSNLVTLLRRDPDVETVQECGSGREAITMIRDLKPDLLFLDVQMPECDGFDVLEAVGQALPPALVFVTAYDEYALRAFEAGALDYLLKPFDNGRFERASARAKEKLAYRKECPGNVERLVVKEKGRVLFLRVPDIDWIESADYYSGLHVGPKTHLLRRSLTDLEEELDPNMFCRIHRSAIVNLGRVDSLQFGEDGESEVALKNGVRLRLSRRYRKQVQSRLGLHE